MAPSYIHLDPLTHRGCGKGRALSPLEYVEALQMTLHRLQTGEFPVSELQPWLDGLTGGGLFAIAELKRVTATIPEWQREGDPN
jgi:hypothetical protein